MTGITTAVILILTLGATLVGVYWLIKRAQSWSLIDRPNERSSHQTPTPRGGGLWFFPVVAAVGIAAVFWLKPEYESGIWIGYSLFCGGALALIGFFDDLNSLPSRLRLALQAGLIIPLVWLGPDWSTLELPGLPPLEWGILGKILLFCWFVGMINVYNFMDGIDGIATLQGIAALVGVLWIAWTGQMDLIWILAVSTLGSLLGFLYFNRFRAKIFMGDVGSNFLGFLFAWFPVAMLTTHGTGIPPTFFLILSCYFLAPFLLDGALTFLRRLLNREDVLAAHRSHLYQRMTRMGYSHGKVTLLYFVWALITGLPGLVAVLAHTYHQTSEFWIYAPLVPTLAFLGVLFRLTRHAPE